MMRNPYPSALVLDSESLEVYRVVSHVRRHDGAQDFRNLVGNPLVLLLVPLVDEVQNRDSLE